MNEMHVFVPIGNRLSKVRFDELERDMNPAHAAGMTLQRARLLIKAIKAIEPIACSVIGLDHVTGNVRTIEIYWRYNQVPYSDEVLYFESDLAHREIEDLTLLFRRSDG